MAEKTAEKITVTYSDGSVKELKRGLVFHLGEVQENGNIEITAEMVDMSGKDLFTVVTAAVDLGMKLGMFGDMEGTDDEES